MSRIPDDELERLLADLESDRVERKESFSERDRIAQAICAFANDMPDHRKPGVLFVGAKNDGSGAHLTVTDELLCNLASIRSDGNVLPVPTISVEKRTFGGCQMAVVVVEPADSPPVRYKGRVYIRVGPRRAIASQEEERRLNEKRRSRDLPFDLHPIAMASIDDFELDMFRREYLPAAVAPEVLEANDRDVADQLVSLRFLSASPEHIPTVTGLLVLGKSPADFVPGAYVQFLRIDGTVLSDPISNQLELSGPIAELIRRLDDVLRANIRTATDIRSEVTEARRPDYPLVALQQLTWNALMHRNYETSNAPVRITWFDDRIEIQNPGGPFGQVTRENFGRSGITDYRNPHVAEALKTLGFVQRFGVGISTAQSQLRDNGNPEAEFDVQDNHILATIKVRA